MFVLDMGEPVRIAEMARQMIHLSGFSVRDEGNPQGEIALEFTGLRPGEKLFEELLIGDKVSTTSHPLIYRAQEDLVEPSFLSAQIINIMKASAERDSIQLLEHLSSIVSGYLADSEADGNMNSLSSSSLSEDAA